MIQSGQDETIGSVEDAVADLFGREHAVLTGRGTTALYVLFDVLDVREEVVYPAYTCPSSVYAACYANAKPVFCDIRQDYTIDPDKLDECISPATDAVVAIDLFGHPAMYDRIEEICQKHDVSLIEDACQAVGSTYNETPVGRFGDASVVSFGHKKPLDAGGGGAILTDNTEIANAAATRETKIPSRNETRLEELYNRYRDLYRTIEDLTNLTDQAHQLFGILPDVFEELYIRQFDETLLPKIDSALDDYETVVETRRTHADIYRSNMQHEQLKHPDPLGDPVYYRYSVTLDSETLRDHVVTRLRKSDIHVSTLYDPIHQRFGDWKTYKTAESLSSRTINLWVSQRVDEQYVQETVDAVIESINGFNNE